VLVQKPRSGKIPRKSYKERKNIVSEPPADAPLPDSNILELTCDIIGNQFWTEHPYLIPIHNSESIAPPSPSVPTSNSKEECKLEKSES
jgi:hypothetical protein